MYQVRLMLLQQDLKLALVLAQAPEQVQGLALLMEPPLPLPQVMPLYHLDSSAYLDQMCLYLQMGLPLALALVLELELALVQVLALALLLLLALVQALALALLPPLAPLLLLQLVMLLYHPGSSAC